MGSLRFEYFEPGSREEAIRLLKKHERKIHPLAGGTDLFVVIRYFKERGAKD